MKAKDAIRGALADWRPVADAPSLARETFTSLDAAERDRLALRAYTDEVRTELRRKVDGVPVYTSVVQPGEDGHAKRVYKQTELFDVSDYRVAVTFYLSEAKANQRVARSLARDCYRRYGVQLTLPGLDTAFGEEAA